VGEIVKSALELGNALSNEHSGRTSTGSIQAQRNQKYLKYPQKDEQNNIESSACGHPAKAATGRKSFNG
jgi:hypothetical protein